MASVKLNLSETWQDLGTAMVIGICKTSGYPAEILNADSLPVGYQAAALEFDTNTLLSIPAPLVGNLYIRVPKGYGSISYYEA